ncbi:glycosyltransferase [Nitrospinae bacterium AH-259-F20]|nr:glycosyltransferase [Nitrospinae bacterium AH-259-F20]
MSLLSFEKPSRLSDLKRRERLEQSLKDAGLRWYPLRYHQHPSLPATLYDMVRGVVVASRLVREDRLQVVHARSYVAATMAWLLKRLCGVPFIFDMRGFFADERVEGGLWLQGGILYRAAKLMEGRLLAEADQIVSLSEAGRAVLMDWAQKSGYELPPVHVIPTCVDCDRFRPNEGPEMGSEGPNLLYLGSVGTWYMLDEMLSFFKALRGLRPDARFTFLTPSPPETIYGVASTLGIDESAFLVREVPYETVPENAQEAHASIFFIKPVSSKRASCPTKMGESLACGLPVVINPGVGDTEDLVRRERVGVIVSAWTEEAYDQAARELLALLEEGPSLRQRCREVALRYFSLEVGLSRYEGLYARYGLKTAASALAQNGRWP